MGLKVIQWSTGNVGRFALRQIASHPELELAGVWVHSPDKVGRDAGELAGIDPLGVTATDDQEALLDLGADCVCYTATADLRPDAAIADMARILASGTNVVSSSVVPLVYPGHVDGGHAGAVGGGLPAGWDVVLHLRHRPRVRQRPAPAGPHGHL